MASSSMFGRPRRTDQVGNGADSTDPPGAFDDFPSGADQRSLSASGQHGALDEFASEIEAPPVEARERVEATEPRPVAPENGPRVMPHGATARASEGPARPVTQGKTPRKENTSGSPHPTTERARTMQQLLARATTEVPSRASDTDIDGHEGRGPSVFRRARWLARPFAMAVLLAGILGGSAVLWNRSQNRATARIRPASSSSTPVVPALASPVGGQAPTDPGTVSRSAADAIPAEPLSGAPPAEVPAKAAARVAKTMGTTASGRSAAQDRSSPQPAFAFSEEARGEPWAVAMSSDGTANPVATTGTSGLPDSPPRRIPGGVTTLTLTTLGRRTLEGQLSLMLDISAQGEVREVSVVDAGGEVDQTVVKAVQDLARAWRYEPARRGGVAVPSRTFVVLQMDAEGTSR